ncbi:MAG: GNAT family N-acetyltransferase [Candidatus Eisenbacteria bacterium]|uniref:GNAT family N-acetyltransferase n=1 Tax=Eiseniibacteriota bacterium TaxID=2212470 RepID=A0A948W7J5_UNCEI|nr:GNAT family N-acetyltransferase [Candidatus Eisenbacteria bacterium]MBU1948130.1 GNAT family N-acetyltransferase [Candidatus Eisenbacteria bacterium]MBU2692664.1 GNAT family N-acetyltransferase [Candidatus Eisenbacteria bacterium]
MKEEILSIGPEQLSTYASIPIRFEVNTELRARQIDGGLGGIKLEEIPVSSPYMKDYDALDHSGPENWPKKFNVQHWGFFLMLLDGQPSGGAAVAVKSDTVHMLEGRNDLAVLWDLRIAPDVRNQGFGGKLFQYALSWAKARHYRQMKIETQNINVPACKFYMMQGCHLGAIHRYGYAAVPAVAHEAMLFWYIDLD